MQAEREGNALTGGIPPLRGAEIALLAKRRAQRGRPTLGDDADRAFVEALRAMPTNAETLAEARTCGVELGAAVYSRRFFEDTMPGALALLSTSLLESGLGALRLDTAFHRTARVSYMPSADVEPAHPDIRAALVEGVLEGYLSSSFNCAARARAQTHHTFEIELLDGRDVNHVYGRRNV